MARQHAASQRRQEKGVFAGGLSSATLFGNSKFIIPSRNRLQPGQRIIRKTFWEAVEGKKYTWHPSVHITHCFDAIRQVSKRQTKFLIDSCRQ